MTFQYSDVQTGLGDLADLYQWLGVLGPQLLSDDDEEKIGCGTHATNPSSSSTIMAVDLPQPLVLHLDSSPGSHQTQEIQENLVR